MRYFARSVLLPERLLMSSTDPIALFRQAVDRWPENIALVVGEEQLSYADLDRRSDAIAAELVRAGAVGQRVVLIADRTTSWVFEAVLGIMKAGASCVPLLPEGPLDRWTSMLDRCGARLGLISPSGSEAALRVERPHVEWIAPKSESNGMSGALPVPVSNDQEAYVLFTSGSTGGPKGVGVSRANLSAYLGHLLARYQFSASDRFSQHFALPFDLSFHDLFVCWASGATLCVRPESGWLRAAAWARSMGITVWFSAPSLAGVMRRARALTVGALPSIRYSFFCGEALPWQLAQDWRIAAPASRIINLYGPTEATIAITSFEILPDMATVQGVVPIGRSIGSDRTLVAPFEGAPPGEGELLLSGPQVTKGYINAPEATQKAFVELPGQEGLWYRTGDHVREDAEGILHFVGRIDHQVKRFGQRIEPGEVDEAMQPLLDGGNAVSVPVLMNGATQLVTFIDVAADVRWLMDQLRTKLPVVYLPERIISLPEIPRNTNGKWDRVKLIQMAQHDAG